MHIPDGFLDAKTALSTGVLAGVGLGMALATVRRVLPPRRIPLLGLTAAFVFAAQMLNFPVAGGTSGHLLGGVLTAVLLGPAAGILVITAVLIVQCLVFADGGLLSLGANILNMGIVGTAGGYVIYSLVRGRNGSLRRKLAAAAFASWCSVALAAVSCAAQLAFSGTAAWGAVLPMMAGIHMVIGIGEAVITALVLSAVHATRPELLEGSAAGAALNWKGAALAALLVALVLGALLSPFASSRPDGLERVSERLGFDKRAVETSPAPARDYAFPGIRSPVAATALAGAAGTVAMFVFALIFARAIAPRDGEQDKPSGPG